MVGGGNSLQQHCNSFTARDSAMFSVNIYCCQCEDNRRTYESIIITETLNDLSLEDWITRFG
jgi:hypothetical protein